MELSSISNIREIEENFAINLDGISLAAWCTTSVNASALCNNVDFMRLWIRRHHPDIIIKFDNFLNDVNAAGTYPGLLSIVNQIKLGNRITTPNSIFEVSFKLACRGAGRQGDLNLYKYITASSGWSVGNFTNFIIGLLETNPEPYRDIIINFIEGNSELIPREDYEETTDKFIDYFGQGKETLDNFGRKLIYDWYGNIRGTRLKPALNELGPLLYEIAIYCSETKKKIKMGESITQFFRPSDEEFGKMDAGRIMGIFGLVINEVNVDKILLSFIPDSIVHQNFLGLLKSGNWLLTEKSHLFTNYLTTADLNNLGGVIKGYYDNTSEINITKNRLRELWKFTVNSHRPIEESLLLLYNIRRRLSHMIFDDMMEDIISVTLVDSPLLLELLNNYNYYINDTSTIINSLNKENKLLFLMIKSYFKTRLVFTKPLEDVRNEIADANSIEKLILSLYKAQQTHLTLNNTLFNFLINEFGDEYFRKVLTNRTKSSLIERTYFSRIVFEVTAALNYEFERIRRNRAIIE